MLQAELRVVGGKHHGKVIPLSKSKFLIGRESDCQLRPNSELVSRHHCVFTVDQYSVRLRDLGSTNGTFINGEQIHGVAILETGNKVSIGKLEFEIVIKEVTDVPGAPGMSAPEPEHETEQLSQASTATEFELPVQAFPDQQVPSDTAILQPGQPTTPPPIVPPGATPPGGFQQPMAPYPQTPGYQTPPGGFPQMPVGYPPQQPMMPQFQQPIQQPGMYPPGAYPQQPMGYPQQPPMGYPPQQQQPQPVAPAAPPEPQQEVSEPEDSSSTGEVTAPPIQLPDPSTTGATAKVEAPPSQGDDGEKKEPESNPSSSAADIIKQRLNPKPGGFEDDK